MLDALQGMQQLVEVYNKVHVIPTAAEDKDAMTFAPEFLDTYSFLRE